MDIKPENILVFDSAFSNVGTWKLIDFGITTISEKKRRWTEGGAREKGSIKHVTVTVGTTPKSMASRYQPPEINSNIDILGNGEGSKYMGRGSDMWSLACVFAEVVAANMGELNLLNQNLTDYFYTRIPVVWSYSALPIHLRYRRHHIFNDWLERLRKQGDSQPSLKICHELIDEMTDIERIRRLKSQQVSERLREFCQRSVQSLANKPSQANYATNSKIPVPPIR